MISDFGKHKLNNVDKWNDLPCLCIFDGHDEKLIKMRQDGMTLKQIGAYFAVGVSTVS